jgi:transcription antitermination factor NusG
MTETDLQAYCILCRTGAEQEVKQKIETFMTGIEAIVPTRILEEKKDRQWQKVERPLLPGYVFLYSAGELPHDLIWKINHLYRILQYERGLRSLQSEDRDYAFWLYRHQGQIKPSTVLQEGETIRVIDGPLLDATGTITRLDKRHRRAWVSFSFDGETRIVSLSANCVENASSK